MRVANVVGGKWLYRATVILFDTFDVSNDGPSPVIKFVVCFGSDECWLLKVASMDACLADCEATPRRGRACIHLQDHTTSVSIDDQDYLLVLNKSSGDMQSSQY